MKLKTAIAAVALSISGLMALGVSSAAATTFEIGGAQEKKEVKFTATLSGSSLFSDTFGTTLNTCLSSTIEGNTAVNFTANAAPIGGPLTKLEFGNCVEEVVRTDATGTFTVDWINNTTNGTLRSTNAKVTVPSPLGVLTCTTNNTDIGTLTGVVAGFATMDINAVLNCGLVVARWTATYRVTNPLGLGVIA